MDEQEAEALEWEKSPDNWRNQCRVCHEPIPSGEMCLQCAADWKLAGYDPFFTAKNKGDYFA